MPTNLVLPYHMKAFLFVTDDDPMDSKVEETILFLTERYGWKEHHARIVSVDTERGSQLLTVDVRYHIPMEFLK